MPVGTQNTKIPGCGTHHVAVQTRDWQASLRLYQDVMGMTTVAEFGTPERKIMLLDTGDGSHMELFQPTHETPEANSASPNDPLTHVAFATTDARAAIEQVRQAGYEVTVEPKEVNLGGLEVTVAFFKGPCGEILEFFQTH
ncbi:MAG: VOC family protein [Candidatus Latescibacteria bacterium]|nr:VOC family protein [Candidatus Latescibacterota bacterium]